MVTKRYSLRTKFLVLSAPVVLLTLLLVPSAAIPFWSTQAQLNRARSDVAIALAVSRFERANEQVIGEVLGSVIVGRANTEEIRGGRNRSVAALADWSAVDRSVAARRTIDAFLSAIRQIGPIVDHVVSLERDRRHDDAVALLWGKALPLYKDLVQAPLHHVLTATLAPLDNDYIRIAGAASSIGGLTTASLVRHVTSARSALDRAIAFGTFAENKVTQNRFLVEYLIGIEPDTNGIDRFAQDARDDVDLAQAIFPDNSHLNEAQAVRRANTQLDAQVARLVSLRDRGDVAGARSLFGATFEPAVDANASLIERVITADERTIYSETSRAISLAHVLQMAALLFAFILAAAAIASLLNIERISRRIARLTGAARKIGRGELSLNVPVEAPDELGELGTAFNTMTASLDAAQQRADRLLEQTVDSAETERRRVAADLHDGPVQQLTSVLYGLERVGLRFDRADLAGAATLLDELKSGVSTEVTALRRMMAELRPPALDQRGLAAALSDYVTTFGRDEGIPCQLVVDVTHRLPSSLETTVYRIVQEALTNVRKHSNATAVTISLTETPRVLWLKIRDDGVGFDASELPSSSEHFGVSSMRERVKMTGGTFAVQSSLGRGTTVDVTIPVAPQVAA